MPDPEWLIKLFISLPSALAGDLTAGSCSSHEFYFALATLLFLLVGLALCVRFRSRKLLLFIASVLASHALKPTAELMVAAGLEYSRVSLVFLVLQAVFVIFLAHWSKGARLPAFFLALFSMMYALFADGQAWSYFYGGCA